MKTRFLCTNILLAAFTLIALAGTVTPPADLPAYYSGLDGKSGSTLFDAIHSVTVKGFKTLGYDGALTAYQTTDVYPEDSVGKAGLLWDMYGGCKFTSGDECGNYSRECDCYNREHSIPKSWWGGNKNETYSDIFHLVPTDGYVNNRRSAYAFGEVDNVTYSYKGAKLGSPKTISTDNTMNGNLSLSCPKSPVFEPIDQYKGDFARGYLGILAHYTSLSITKGDGSAMFSGASGSSNTFGLTNYGIALLLKWHRMDPVSRKEIDRNNGIQKTQGNRNPFIDYPDLAEYLWGSHAGEAFDLATATATFSDDYDPTTGGGGTVDPPVFEPFDFILYCNGVTKVITSTTATYTLPTDVANACEEWIFSGWSATKVEQTTDKPTYITFVKEATTVYAVYKNTVTDGEGSTDKSITFAEQGYSNGADVTTVNMDNCQLTFAKNDGANAPKYYDSGSAVRCYPKNSLTITSESEITKVAFATVDSYAGTVNASVGDYAEGIWTGNSQEIIFKHEPSGNAQWRIKAITVTTGGGSTTITYASDVTCTPPSGPTYLETTDETHIQIFINEDTIRSNGFVRIYDITGKEVTRFNGTLSGGIYIIRTAEGAQKVLVP